MLFANTPSNCPKMMRNFACQQRITYTVPNLDYLVYTYHIYYVHTCQDVGAPDEMKESCLTESCFTVFRYFMGWGKNATMVRNLAEFVLVQQTHVVLSVRP